MTISGSLSVESKFRFKSLPYTPLQKAVGLRVSEEIYDQLEVADQIIVDLLAEGWKNYEIAELFAVNRSWITNRVHQIRNVLANGQLKKHLEIRQEIKEMMRGDSEFNY